MMELSQLSATPSIATHAALGGGGSGAPGNITPEDFLAMMLGNLSATSSPSISTAVPTDGLSLLNDTFFGFVGFFNSSSPALNFAGDGTSLFGNLSVNGSLVSGDGNTPSFAQGTYPSGYKLPQIVLASVFVTILMVIIVVGNMLVIIAIATEKSLKNIQNWFIASLAVSDFFLGLVIMPFSLANELMGYWVFGGLWCDIHSAMDVLLSTASIMNLCLISLDRYWSITKAIEYLRQRTPARAAIMIMMVWILSALICIPPLLGWKVKLPDGPLPQCQLSEDLGYVLYSALGSFYIPSCIMVFVYIRIYFAAKRRARRGIKKVPKKPIAPSEQQVTSFSLSPSNVGSRPMPSVPSTSSNNNKGPPNNNSTSAPNPIPTVTCDLASDLSGSDAACDNNTNGMETYDVKDTLRVATITRNASTTNGNCDPVSPAHNNNSGRCRALSVAIDTDMVSEFEPSSSDSGIISRTCANVRPLRFKLFNKARGSKKEQHQEKQASQGSGRHTGESGGLSPRGGEVAELEPALPKKERMKDPEKEKRRIARKKEKRATLILGLIMGSFIASWLPFFFLYILTPMCPACNIPESAFSIAFWLGYMNSALNPVIYTIFNKDFRRAFRRILFK